MRHQWVYEATNLLLKIKQLASIESGFSIRCTDSEALNCRWGWPHSILVPRPSLSRVICLLCLSLRTEESGTSQWGLIKHIQETQAGVASWWSADAAGDGGSLPKVQATPGQVGCQHPARPFLFGLSPSSLRSALARNKGLLEQDEQLALGFYLLKWFAYEPAC